MKILDILADKLKLSPGEETLFSVWLNRLERDALTLSKQSTSTGGGVGVNVGNVEISLEDGVTLYNPGTGARTIYLDPDGDAWFGDDIDSPADTALSIFSNAQTYNSENMGEGDLLLGDNSSGKANLLWDKSAGQLKLRSGTTEGIVLDADGTLQSGNYSSGASGWIIEPDGDAEFNSITARGTFKTAVFEVDNVVALGGHFLVSKNAGEVAVDVTSHADIDGNFNLTIKDDSSDNVIAAVDDVLRIKAWNGSAVIDVWVTVEGVTPGTGTSVYDCNLESGQSKDIQRGMAVVNYGPANAGVIHLEAGSQSTRLRIATHAGAPWTTMANKVVLGNMRATFGTGANDRYGLGMGDYSGGNYLSYNAEAANAFILRGGDGAVTIDANGLMLLGTSSAPAPEAIRWYYDDGGGPMDEQGGRMFFGFDGVAGHDGVLYIEAMYDGSGGHNPWGDVELWLSAWNTDTDASVNVILDLGADTIVLDANRVHVDSGDINTVPWTDYSGTSTFVGWASTTTKHLSYKKVGNLVFVHYAIVGTSGGSDGTKATFTLPFNVVAPIAYFKPAKARNSGGNLSGASYGRILSSNIATFYINETEGAWTASGQKVLIGQFFYEAA